MITSPENELGAGLHREQQPCSRSSDVRECGAVTISRNGYIEQVERERDMWKANHDNQVEIKRIIVARPDLKDRAPMVEKLMAERNRAQGWSTLQHARIKRLESAIRKLDPTNENLPENEASQKES